MAALHHHCFAQALSICDEQGLLFVAVASLVVELRLQAYRLQWLWHMGLVVPQCVGSSQTMDQTPVPCISWWILNYWLLRQVLILIFLSLLNIYKCASAPIRV